MAQKIRRRNNLNRLSSSFLRAHFIPFFHDFTKKYGGYGTVGIHPHHGDDARQEDFELIEKIVKENEKIDNYRLREVSNIIFKRENISLIVMGTTKGLTKKLLKDWLEV